MRLVRNITCKEFAADVSKGTCTSGPRTRKRTGSAFEEMRPLVRQYFSEDSHNSREITKD